MTTIPFVMKTNRRRFLKRGLFMAGTAFAVPHVARSAQPAYKAAIIGHTGQGNYGHGLDLIFNHRPDVQVVAVADPDEEGRAQAQERSRAARAYADYREMLDKETPDLVSIAPRWTNQHHAMAMATLESGAHLYMEKPFTRTLAEADEILALAGRKDRRIAVAHQTRLAPSILFLKQRMQEGLLGQLVQIDAHGKQDRRAGGEDMVVLGTHLFDLMRYLAGDVEWCSADILQEDREAVGGDIHAATENIGPILGNRIHAQFAFPNAVQGSFTSREDLRETLGPWGLMLTGSKGQVRVMMNMVPNLSWREAGTWSPASGWDKRFRALPGDPSAAPDVSQSHTTANRRVVDDWMEAIADGREPVCSGRAGMKSLEMIMGVFQAGLARQRVPFPMTLRAHPLEPSA